MRRKRLPLGEAVAKISSSKPILVTDEGRYFRIFLVSVGIYVFIISLIRLFQFAFLRQQIGKSTFPQGKALFRKQPFILERSAYDLAKLF